MTELVNRPVDNGERLPVSSPFFEGMAGVRRNEEGGEFACIGRIPVPRDRFGGGANRMAAILDAAVGTGKGTVDGRAVQILSLRMSDVATGLLIARFQYSSEV